MKEYTYDDIYGISLQEYCEMQQLSIEKLISMIETDIDILRKNLHKHVRETLPFLENWELVTEIKKTIDKKEKHLRRLKEYHKRSVK